MTNKDIVYNCDTCCDDPRACICFGEADAKELQEQMEQADLEMMDYMLCPSHDLATK